MKPGRSLKARALQLLAQREQSRVELRRKLLVHARALAAEAVAPAALSNGPAGSASAEPDPEAQVEAVLAWLEAHRYLNAERFAESRVNARYARFGNLRIRLELARHDVTLPADLARTLQESEFDRAAAVLERKFGPVAPESDRDAARQARFLAARGFSADVIRRAVRAARERTPAPD